MTILYKLKYYIGIVLDNNFVRKMWNIVRLALYKIKKKKIAYDI